MCTSVVPLRCHVASNTPHRPHLCCTSLVALTRYGIHPRHAKQQRPAAHALSIILATIALVFHTLTGLHHYLLRRISRLKRRICHAPLPARWAIRRRRSTPQTRNRRCGLVHGAAGLLGRHAWLKGSRAVGARGLRLHVGALGVRLRGRRAGVLLGLLLWLSILLLLSLLLRKVRGVGVLVVDGRLLVSAGHVGGLRVLLHGDLEWISP
jgi:hypothetical protein